MTDVLLPTSLVGSYAQPDWLINRNKLAGRGGSARNRCFLLQLIGEDVAINQQM